VVDDVDDGSDADLTVKLAGCVQRAELTHTGQSWRRAVRRDARIAKYRTTTIFSVNRFIWLEVNYQLDSSNTTKIIT